MKQRALGILAATVALAVGVVGFAWIFLDADPGTARRSQSTNLASTVAAVPERKQPELQELVPAETAATVASDGLHEGPLTLDGAAPPRDDSNAQTRLASDAAARLHRIVHSDGASATCDSGDLRVLAVNADPASRLWKWTLLLLRWCMHDRSEHALGLLDEVLELHPADAGLVDMALISALVREEPDRALAIVRNAVPLTTDTTDLARLASHATLVADVARNKDEDLRRQAYEVAEQSVERARSMEPDALGSWELLNLAEAQLGQGRPLEAISTVEQAALLVSTDSRDAGHKYFKSGKIYYQAGQRDIGIAYMDQGISLMSPKDREHHIYVKFMVLNPIEPNS